MKIKFLLIFILGLASTNFFLLTHITRLPLAVSVFSLFTLFFVPGVLTLMSLKVQFRNVWMVFLHSMGISISYVYILGLIASYFLPGAGFERPLEIYPFAYLHFGLVVLLFGLAMIRNWHEGITAGDFSKMFFKLLGLILSVTLSLISIVGAFYLNNGVANTITISWLAVLVIVFFIVSFFQNKKYDFLRPYIILTMSLSLVWSLSARSWHLIGWDIVQESSVARATFLEGRWSAGDLKDAYNACLSITILPTVISNLTGYSIDAIFKFVYPFVFAQFPVLIYFFLKKMANKNLGFLAVLYVMAQPFFIQPMIGLARQEIAFFFFPLLFLTMNSSKLKGKGKILLTLLYIFALVVSHYSTTYVAIILFGLVYIPVFGLQILKRLPMPHFFKKSNFYINWVLEFKSSLKWWVVAALVLFTYSWYFLITNSAGNVTRAITNSLGNMTQLFQGDQESQEVKKALPGGSKTDYTTQEDLDYFLDMNLIPESGNNLPVEKLNQIAMENPLKPIRETTIKPSIDTGYAKTANLVLSIFKDGLKYFLIAGSLILFIKTARAKSYNLDLVLFASASTLILLVVILHPTLGVLYNISRIYLQLLVFLAFALAVGLDTLLFFLKGRMRTVIICLIFSCGFFYLQGMLVPIIGGFPALQFYNFGTDFEKFYVYQDELNAADWLRDKRDFHNTVYSDDITGLRLRKEAGFFPNTTIIPVVIANNAQSYVFLTATNTYLGKAQVSYNSKYLTYTYPIKMLDEEKNLVYSNSSSLIYK